VPRKKLQKVKENAKKMKKISDQARSSAPPAPPIMPMSDLCMSSLGEEYPLACTAATVKEYKAKWDRRVFGIDCEMVKTTAGSTLARVTMVDEHCKCVLDEFVKPKEDVLDYLTPLSGTR
ncbi:hypothetical protein KIPB_012883, partial [Kipferlia bialata]